MPEYINLTTILIVGGFLFVFMLISMLNKFLVKAEPGQALVKTGFGMNKPKIYLSSSFVIPLLHRVDSIDLTVKTVRIVRRQIESLSCADGIRAEVEVDFYIKINSLEEDIRHVAATIGCAQASDIAYLRELFEAKFADALKTAGALLKFDQLYQNRIAFRDEILRALGQEGNQEVVLNGYKLDDVAIQYLEQLPLEMHNEDNVLDARGRKEIAQRTSSEVEEANKRLRQKEVTIAEQNREARVRQLEINQDIAEKEASQQREVQEAQAREQAATEKTVAEQERLAEEARIQKDRQVRLAQEQKEQAVRAAEIERQRAVELADEQRRQEIEQAQILRERAVRVAEQEKIKQVEIARIEREAEEAEALKAKLKMLEETALQEAEKIKAEEQAQTVRALEVANRQKQIDVIEAEKAAAVEKEMKNVEADVEAYELTVVSRAKLEAAELDAQAAAKQALAIEEVGRAKAAATQLQLEAENVINERVILANTLNDLVPRLPELIEKLMIPAEQIDSIRILNVGGLDGAMNGLPGSASNGQRGSVGGSLVNTVLSVGMVLPVLREVMKGLQGNERYAEVLGTLRSLPGGEALLNALEDSAAGAPALGDGATSEPTTL
ncbi:MAG: flotillin domain-containing protein [Bacteroidota bacterium]